MNKSIQLFCCLVIVTSQSLLATADSEDEVLSIDRVEKMVFQVERNFAKTMANRDFSSFQSFIDEDAVFMSSQGPLRGKQQITDAWKAYFKDKQAPFSWQPETVMVIGSGELALSSGPVKNAKGDIIAYYNSTWRKDYKGDWKIILDKGQKYCEPKTGE